MTIEYRFVKGSTETRSGELHGLVTPFNSQTVIGSGPVRAGGAFREQIMPGAFTKTLQERDIVMLWNHNSDMPLARTSVTEGVGSLALHEDPAAGLRAAATPVQTSYGKDLLQLADAKVVRGMSFGFEVIKDAWTDDDGNESDEYSGTNRAIQEVRLHEVSPVTFPAYTDTELSCRDARGARGERAGNPKPYGDVEYADPKNGKYPIDTVKHAKAAWAYINQADNADVYPLNGVSLAEVKDKIKAALVKFGVQITEENAMALAAEYRAGLAGADAALDSAIEKINGLDRDKLPAEVNQIFDLVSAAAHGVESKMNDDGEPDPDNDGNKSKYADQDDDAERHAADIEIFRSRRMLASVDDL